ncbi:c-type cytochrome [Methylobacterium brachythecii]|nr:cytochrome c553 [Methylobacterium brachythecii]
MPALTGFTVSEIEAAMAAFRSGTRGGTIMPRIAKGFSPGEARAIAAFLGRDRQSAP